MGEIKSFQEGVLHKGKKVPVFESDFCVCGASCTATLVTMPVKFHRNSAKVTAHLQLL